MAPSAKRSKATPSKARKDESRQLLEFAVEEGDIKTSDADVIALKYAQGFHGADMAVALALVEAGVRMSKLQPDEDDYVYVATKGAIRAPHALFVGVAPLGI